MNILADTCFWISLCDPSEKDHIEVVAMMEIILEDGRYKVLVPHPVFYETLCSGMVKKPDQVLTLTKFFERVEKVPDSDYFEEAYRLIERQASNNKGNASMVDIAIMLVANDLKNNVKALLTKNGRDFGSFCQKKGIPMIVNKAVLDSV